MTREEGRKRAAVLGGGAHSLPSYRSLLVSLSGQFEITLFSEFPVDARGVEGYKVCSPPSVIRNQRLRILFFALQVLTHFVLRRFDLIHCHSTYPSGRVASWIKRLFGTPFIVSLDGAEFAAHPDIPFGDLLIPNRESHNQMICTHADAITVLSKFQWTTIAPRLNLNQKPATAIARGVDNKLFYPQPLSIIPPVQFLAVGYLHPVKDYGTMLRAFQRISEHCDAQLTIAGKDYQEEEIQKLAADLGLSSRVVFEGHVPYERIPACYRDAHILLHTARYESYGMAVAEAMACGRLVCGTRVGLMADLSDTCCLTVPVGDHAALAEIVVNLIRDPERQASLRSNALEWSKAHPLTWTTGKFTELYQKVMTPARAR